MSRHAENPADPAHEALRALHGPADEDLEHTGPALDHPDDVDERMLPDTLLPGGIDHTTAAGGAGGLGLALLGLTVLLKRRRNRRHKFSPDD